jgi:hypothetical protein
MLKAPDPADKLDARADGGFQASKTRFASLDEMVAWMAKGGVLSSYESEQMAKAYLARQHHREELRALIEEFDRNVMHDVSEVQLLLWGDDIIAAARKLI